MGVLRSFFGVEDGLDELDRCTGTHTVTCKSDLSRCVHIELTSKSRQNFNSLFLGVRKVIIQIVHLVALIDLEQCSVNQRSFVASDTQLLVSCSVDFRRWRVGDFDFIDDFGRSVRGCTDVLNRRAAVSVVHGNNNKAV